MMLPFVGCYAPMHSPGIDARTLPDQYRWPIRTSANPLNYSHLVRHAPPAYILGPGDKLSLTAPDLIQEGRSDSFEVQVLDSGEFYVPRLGPVRVAGLTVSQAQQRLNTALAAGLLIDPQAVLTLTEKGTVNVLVLGAVQNPGVHALPRFENDVAHALAAAQGFSDFAGEAIEVHRRGAVVQQQTVPTPADNSAPVSPRVVHPPVVTPRIQPQSLMPRQLYAPSGAPQEASLQTFGHSGSGIMTVSATSDPGVPCGEFVGLNIGLCTVPCTSPIVRIPLRGDNQRIASADVTLNPGDVVVIPQKTDKVFYVVGPLSQQNRLRFSVGDRDRQIGNGLLLPDDREVDVVTAVAMAGYIDPIESPTTVTVHRSRPGRSPLLIRVDLLAAREDAKETVMVQPGDIIYLNPDAWWYGRRITDRVIERALGTAIGRWLTN